METETQTQVHENLTSAEPIAETAPVIKVSEWFITILLLSIPLVNIIVLLMWAFGGSTNLNKSNYAKAALLWVVISIVLGILSIVLFLSVIIPMIGNILDSISL